jgi:hypothetical protein
MKAQIGITCLWSLTWALLGWCLFDPESHVNRGPTAISDNRVNESKQLAAATGAVLGAIGGIIGRRLARSNLWWIPLVAIIVGGLAAGGSQVIYELRYPVFGPPGQDAQSPWASAPLIVILGAAVGLPVGLLLMAFTQYAGRYGADAK